MQCLLRCYCGKCEKEFTAWTDITGTLKPSCPYCKKRTDLEKIFELETLQVG